MSDGDADTAPRKGSPSPRLSEEECKRRVRAPFTDPSFDELSEALAVETARLGAGAGLSAPRSK